VAGRPGTANEAVEVMESALLAEGSKRRQQRASNCDRARASVWLLRLANDEETQGVARIEPSRTLSEDTCCGLRMKLQRNDDTLPVIMDKSKATLAVKAEEFYLKEYECLRKEIEWLLKDYRALERNVVIAVGLTWAWLFEKRAPKWTWVIPILFAVLGAIRASGIIKSFGGFHNYISQLEDAFTRTGDPGGWQHSPWHKTGAARGAYWFWSVLIGATVLVAIYRFHID